MNTPDAKCIDMRKSSKIQYSEGMKLNINLILKPHYAIKRILPLYQQNELFTQNLKLL